MLSEAWPPCIGRMRHRFYYDNPLGLQTIGFPQAGSTQLPPDPLGRGRCASLIPSGILLATTGQQVVTWTSQSFSPFAKPDQAEV